MPAPQACTRSHFGTLAFLASVLSLAATANFAIAWCLCPHIVSTPAPAPGVGATRGIPPAGTPAPATPAPALGVSWRNLVAEPVADSRTAGYSAIRAMGFKSTTAERTTTFDGLTILRPLPAAPWPEPVPAGWGPSTHSGFLTSSTGFDCELLTAPPDTPSPGVHRELVIERAGWPARSLKRVVWTTNAPLPAPSPVDAAPLGPLRTALLRGINPPAALAFIPRRDLPVVPIWSGFFLNMLAYCTPFLILRLLYCGASRFRRRRRLRRTLCPTCAYDLRALPPNSPCPECGAVSPNPRANNPS